MPPSLYNALLGFLSICLKKRVKGKLKSLEDNVSIILI